MAEHFTHFTRKKQAKQITSFQGSSKLTKRASKAKRKLSETLPEYLEKILLLGAPGIIQLY